MMQQVYKIHHFRASFIMPLNHRSFTNGLSRRLFLKRLSRHWKGSSLTSIQFSTTTSTTIMIFVLLAFLATPSGWFIPIGFSFVLENDSSRCRKKGLRKNKRSKSKESRNDDRLRARRRMQKPLGHQLKSLHL